MDLWVALVLGMFFGKVLSIAGIGGLLAGFFVRPLFWSVSLSVFVGIIDTLILIEFSPLSSRMPLRWVLAILAAVLMCGLGRMLRRRYDNRGGRAVS